MSLKVSIVVGNPKPRSRTRYIAEQLVHRLLADPPGDTLDAAYRVEVFDLADHAHEMFRWPAESLSAISESIATSDLVVVASPTYKAAYTGLLKAFLDRYQANALRDVKVIALMTGADAGHSMAPTVSLIPVLTELGAYVVGRGLFFVTADMAQVEVAVGAAGEQLRRTLSASPLLMPP